jgi:hypothetical protein
MINRRTPARGTDAVAVGATSFESIGISGAASVMDRGFYDYRWPPPDDCPLELEKGLTVAGTIEASD